VETTYPFRIDFWLKQQALTNAAPPALSCLFFRQRIFAPKSIAETQPREYTYLTVAA
jgi:hypothetical protein